MRPAWKGDNAFTHMLADALVAEGNDVRELGPGWRFIPRSPATIFLHWPDEFFFARHPRQVVRAIALLARLWHGRRRHGLRLVWLVHNLEPHRRDGLTFSIARQRFFALLDGLIFLSQASRDLLQARHPELARVPGLVINHGHYRSRALRPASVPGLPEGRPIRLGFIGRVMRYKAPEALAGAVAAMPAGDMELLIAGACDDPALALALEQVAAKTPGIDLRLGYLEAAEMEAQVDACDAIVMTYRDILNSGSALYALSRGRPFIAPRLGSLVELQRHVGSDWVWLYDGPVSADVLRAAVEWVATTPRVTLPDLSEFDWAKIGRSVADLLRAIVRDEHA